MKAIYLNTEVREAIKKSGLTRYEIANAMEVSQNTLAIWLQSELTEERKKRILEVIKNHNGAKTKAIYLNTDIRRAIDEKKLNLYEVANEMGITPPTFSHWLQKELSQERKEKILAAIENIKE